MRTSIHPGHAFGYKELIQSLLGIEPAPSAVLDAAMWEGGFIMDSHAIDVNGTAFHQYYI